MFLQNGFPAASNNSNKKDWIWCKTNSYRYGQYLSDVIKGQAFLFLSLLAS